MPLMNTWFPPNAILFYSMITDMSQFNLIPSDWIGGLYEFSDSDTPENFELMDIFIIAALISLTLLNSFTH